MGVDNNSENLENQNNKKNIDSKSLFLKEFSKNILNSKDKNSYIDEIISKDSIGDSDLLKKQIKYIKAYNDKLKDFDEDKINIYDLRRAISKEALALDNARKSYLEHTFSSYDLNDKQKDKLEKEIKNKSETELNELIYNQRENDKFLTKLFGNKINKFQKLNFLDKLSSKDIEKRLKKYDENTRKIIESILFNLNSGKVYDTDLRDLFSYDFFNPEEKKEILTTFIPYVSLQKAVDLEFLTKQEAEEKKKKILEKRLDDKNITEKVDEIIDSASLGDISIKTSEFFNNNENLDRLANGVGFIKVEENFNKYVNKAKKEAVKNGPKNLEELKLVLQEKFGENFIGAENFKKGGIIRLSYIDDNGEQKNGYSRIEEIDETKKTLKIRPIGDNTTGEDIINFNSNANLETINFADFLDGKTKVNAITVFDEQNLKEKIKAGKLNIKKSDLTQYKAEDLKNNPELIEKVTQEYKGDLQSQIDEFDKKIEQINEDIKSLEKEDSTDLSKQRIKDLKLEKESLELQKKYIEEQLKELENGSLSTPKLLFEINKNELIKKLDEIDEQGKGSGLEKGMFLSRKDGKGIYEITGIDEDTGLIHLNSQGKNGPQPEALTFEEFYEAFKKNKVTRLRKLNSLEEFLKENQQKSAKSDIWSNYEVKDGKLHIKDLDKDSKIKDSLTEYLVRDDSDNLIKIEKIENGQVTYKVGERKDINKLDEKQKKKFKKNIKYEIKDGKKVPVKDDDGNLVYEGDLISLSKDSWTVSLAEFNGIINKPKKEYYPDVEIGKQKEQTGVQDLDNKFHNSASTRFFNGMSILELYMGGKTMIEGIQEYLKKGNDIHSAKFALSLGKILPEEVREDLVIKVERSEQEAMDKEVEALGKVDSGIATKRIKKWLLNKDTPEYKKEAGLMFVLSKYGVLTGKSALHEFKGKFIWYQAFGGRIGDDLYNQVKKEAESSNPPQAFSEEKLMYVLINRQSKGALKPKRRSRLYKDYDGKWKNGIKEEVQKGYDDASNFRTAEDMVKGGNSELMTGTLPNAIGWYKKAIERGGSLENMSEGFFLMLFSGALYTTDQAVYTTYIKSMWDADGMPQIMARMSSNLPDMKLFNKSVVELSKEIEFKEPSKYSGMAKEAERIYKRALNNQGTEKERLEDSKKFWDKYGQVLSRAFFMTNGVGDEEIDKDFVSTDKIVIEKSIGEHKNSVLQQYYKRAKAYSTEGTFKSDFMKDAMGFEGVGGLNILENTKIFLQMTQGGGLREEKAGNIFWERFEKAVKYQKSKIVLKEMLRELFSGFIANHGGNLNALKSYNYNTNIVGETLNSWNINVVRDLGNFSAKDILEGKADNVINKAINNILFGKGSISDSYNSGFENVIENVKEKAANNIDYSGEQAA